MATVLLDVSKVSIKRLAWLFGVAKKNSDEETALYRLLLDKADEIKTKRADRVCAADCPDCVAEKAGI